MVRRCWGLLCVVWTGWMKPHWLAGEEPQTSPLGGQWLQLQYSEVEMRDMERSSLHPGQEDPLPQRVLGQQVLEQGVRVSGGPCCHCFAGQREIASRHLRAHFLRHGPDRLGLRGACLALQEDETEIEGKRQRKKETKEKCSVLPNENKACKVEKLTSGREADRKLIGAKQTETQSGLREKGTRAKQGIMGNYVVHLCYKHKLFS